MEDFLKKADIVIHAGDPDDEGQLLIDEILQIGAAIPIEICHLQHLLSFICHYDTWKQGRKQGETG